MREPNYSESQLQQAANTALIRHLYALHGIWAFANVPSLVAEFDLGWDTAFFFPWLSQAPSSADEGCNFFLQYKLSGELISPGAKQWQDWREDYFRFTIPHCTRDTSGTFVDDYHQWNCLKALANRGYPAFYATNATLFKADLQDAMEKGTLLDHVPLLDVRIVSGLHKHVTFTASSSVFHLHSEKEEVKKLSFSHALSGLSNQRQTSFATSTRELVNALQELATDDQQWLGDLARVMSATNEVALVQGDAWVQHARLAFFVRRHLGSDLIWLPKRT